jgi:hypothetical protein
VHSKDGRRGRESQPVTGQQDLCKSCWFNLLLSHQLIIIENHLLCERGLRTQNSTVLREGGREGEREREREGDEKEKTRNGNHTCSEVK